MDQRSRATAALQRFLDLDLARALDEHAAADPLPALLEHFAETARRVPAYAAFLSARGVDPATVRTLDDFRRLPLSSKADYVAPNPLPSLCLDGRLESCDMLAVSSGSTGEPTLWPRFASDELPAAERFEQVLRAFEADRRRTLAVVCFPLGTWVGGMYTAACLRHVATKGYPVVVVTPGNQKAEIYRAWTALVPHVEQVVLLGYPPFLKDVIDHGPAAGVDWKASPVKLVMAGEVFSEEWRALVAERAGVRRPLLDTASLYGTADGGPLACETPVSIAIRRLAARDRAACVRLFGDTRLPTLGQYDPFHRYFEEVGGALVFSGAGGAPLVRYNILDRGGVVPWEEMHARLREIDPAFDAVAEARAAGAREIHALPFVYVFGRGHFAVSIYGANVFPETVAVGLEQPEVRDDVTGKFVMEVKEDSDRNAELRIAVELAAGRSGSDALRHAVAASIGATLARLSSEYAAYVPIDRRTPRVTLWPQGHPEHFPVGVKHRYSRK